jgi:hypothetical protein
MPLLLWILFLAPPALAVLFGTAEHLGWVDKLTGRAAACEALERLNSTAGHPTSWIEKNGDGRHYRAIEKRISRLTRSRKLRRVLNEGRQPNFITSAGQPLELTKVPDLWPQEHRFVWLPNTPVMYIFGDASTEKVQKGERACSLAEIEDWLKNEKDSQRYMAGVVVLGLISIALLTARLSLQATYTNQLASTTSATAHCRVPGAMVRKLSP